MANKLTLNNMKNILSPTYEKTTITYYSEDGKEANIEFDTNLSIIEISNFVDIVSDGVFTALDEYVPEYRDLWTFVALIKISNMPLPKKKVKDSDDVIDVKLAYEWMQKLGIVERLKRQDEELGELLTLFNKLNPMITDKIEFKKQEILSAQKMELARSQFELDMAMNTLSEFAKQFEGVDLNELTQNVGQLAKKDEKKLAEGIIDLQSARENKNN